MQQPFNTFCTCEHCRAFQHPHHNTYLHAGAGDVWPNTTPEPRLTRTILAEAVERARREGYEAGNEAGYEIGYDHGYSQGTDDGFSDGVADGYDDGFDDGYAEALADERAEAAFALPNDEWVEGWGRVS